MKKFFKLCWQRLKQFSDDVKDHQNLFFIEEQISELKKKKLRFEENSALGLELEMYLDSSHEIQTRIDARRSRRQQMAAQ